MLGKSLKNKRVFITGITGFIGSALANSLKEEGALVYGLSRTHKGKRVIKGEVTNARLIDSIIKDKQIQVCFHLAGESLVESGQQSPYSTFKVNIEGTLNVLESCRINGIEKIIIASSSHVYGKNKVPYYEGLMPRPSRPYETSKACNDLIAQSYANTYNLPVLIPRFVNVYGPGDTNFLRLIPRTVRSVLTKKTLQMWGGSSIRDYLYIDDAVSAYMSLAAIDIEKVGRNRIVNFGTGRTISVKDLIEKIIHLANASVKIERIDPEREDEIPIQYLATEKARRTLGWRARVSLEDGLVRTIDWYRRYLKGVDSK